MEERGDRLEKFVIRVLAEAADADVRMHLAVRARHDQQMSWLVLCDRGWPQEHAVEGVDFAVTGAWMSAWGDLLALPIRVRTPRDLMRMLTLLPIRRRLKHAESALREMLPEGLWAVVDPLDDTGRATLSYLLQAIVVWEDALTRVASASRQKDKTIAAFQLISLEAESLGLLPPTAPLDLDAWRSLAAEARQRAAECVGTASPPVAAIIPEPGGVPTVPKPSTGRTSKRRSKRGQ